MAIHDPKVESKQIAKDLNIKSLDHENGHNILKENEGKFEYMSSQTVKFNEMKNKTVN